MLRSFTETRSTICLFFVWYQVVNWVWKQTSASQRRAAALIFWLSPRQRGWPSPTTFSVVVVVVVVGSSMKEKEKRNHSPTYSEPTSGRSRRRRWSARSPDFHVDIFVKKNPPKLQPIEDPSVRVTFDFTCQFRHDNPLNHWFVFFCSTSSNRT